MLDQFKNPPPQYRLAPFWVWNEIPEPDEIDRQVREMHAKGIGGFFINGRPASRVNGSAEQLLAATQHACQAAERLGMHVYQYEDQPLGRKLPALLETKLATSAVHNSGRARALGKVFGSHGWSLVPNEMKRVIDQQACLGINFFVPEAFYYTIAGVPARGFAPSQFYQSTYWRYYKQFSDYAARLSYVLSQGKHCAQAAVLRPGAHSDRLGRDMIPWLEAICQCLLAEHIDFDIVDEPSMAQATCADEQLSLAGEDYELLIMPPLVSVAHRTAEKIQAYANEGGKVIAMMMLPAEDSFGEDHAGVREIMASVFDAANAGRVHMLQISRTSDLEVAFKPAIEASVKREVSIRRGAEECSDISCTRRWAAGLDIFFLANSSGKAREVKISFRCDGAPHMLNLETGDCTALPNCTQQGNRTVLLHHFEPHGSLMVAFSSEPAWAVAPPMVDGGQEIALASEWEFVPEQPNCLTLPDWTFNTLIQGDREFHEYTTSFDAEIVPEDLRLALEQTSGFRPSDGLKVFINDKQTPELGPWFRDIGIRTVDISSLAIRGHNAIRMVVEREAWTGDPVAVPARGRVLGSFCLDIDSAVLRGPRKLVRDGSWTEQGYPFYSGTAAYRQTAFIPEFARGQRVLLRANNPAGMVEFVVNGAIAGVRAWAPFEVDITSLVKPGLNQVELRVTNSLANMMLSDPKPSGLLEGAEALLA